MKSDYIIIIIRGIKTVSRKKMPDSEVDFWLLHSLLANEVIRVEVKHLHPF